MFSVSEPSSNLTARSRGRAPHFQGLSRIAALPRISFDSLEIGEYDCGIAAALEVEDAVLGPAMLSSPISIGSDSADKFVSPLLQAQEQAVSLSRPIFAEQCIGMTCCCEYVVQHGKHLTFFISPCVGSASDEHHACACRRR